MGTERRLRSSSNSHPSQFHQRPRVADIRVTNVHTQIDVFCTPASRSHADKGLFDKDGVQSAYYPSNLVAGRLGRKSVIRFGGYKDNEADVWQISLRHKKKKKKNDVLSREIFGLWYALCFLQLALRAALKKRYLD